jgi:hypothetical protein
VAASDSYLGRPFLLAFLSPRPGAAVQSIDSKEFSLWRRNQALGLEDRADGGAIRVLTSFTDFTHFLLLFCTWQERLIAGEFKQIE